MILDTSALIAVLFREPEAPLYARLIHDAEGCLISAGSYLELSIVIERQAGPETDRQCEMFLRRAGILIEPFTVEQAHLARHRVDPLPEPITSLPGLFSAWQPPQIQPLAAPSPI
jgi:ribonuclease VapC